MSGPVPTLLQRETFELSRAMEFFSDRELTAQNGGGSEKVERDHGKDRSPHSLFNAYRRNKPQTSASANRDYFHADHYHAPLRRKAAIRRYPEPENSRLLP